MTTKQIPTNKNKITIDLIYNFERKNISKLKIN